jgi:uncharacterized membrane protein
VLAVLAVVEIMMVFKDQIAFFLLSLLLAVGVVLHLAMVMLGDQVAVPVMVVAQAVLAQLDKVMLAVLGQVLLLVLAVVVVPGQ